MSNTKLILAMDTWKVVLERKPLKVKKEHEKKSMMSAMDLRSGCETACRGAAGKYEQYHHIKIVL